MVALPDTSLCFLGWLAERQEYSLHRSPVYYSMYTIHLRLGVI